MLRSSSKKKKQLLLNLDQEFNQKKSLVDDLQRDYNNLKELHSYLDNTTVAKKAENRRLTEKIAKIEPKYTNMTIEISNFKAEKQEFESEKQAFQKKYESEKQAFEKKNYDLDSKITFKKDKLTKIETCINKYKESIPEMITLECFDGSYRMPKSLLLDSGLPKLIAMANTETYFINTNKKTLMNLLLMLSDQEPENISFGFLTLAISLEYNLSIIPPIIINKLFNDLEPDEQIRYIQKIHKNNKIHIQCVFNKTFKFIEYSVMRRLNGENSDSDNENTEMLVHGSLITDFDFETPDINVNDIVELIDKDGEFIVTNVRNLASGWSKFNFEKFKDKNIYAIDHFVPLKCIKNIKILEIY
jgi:hypothetical protein